MKKEDFVKLGIEEELAKKCESAVAEMLKGYIPKTRFDEVNNEKKRLELDVRDRDGQLEKLKNSTGDVEELKKQIETLQNDNKAKDEAHKAEIKQMKIDNAVESALVGAKAKNSLAVKALLKDLDKAELLEDGTIKGLAEQLTALQKSDSYLFDAKETKKQFKGAKIGEPGDDTPGEMTIDEFKKLSPLDRHKFAIDNPDKYKEFYGGNA
jgi:hypothetical protein